MLQCVATLQQVSILLVCPLAELALPDQCAVRFVPFTVKKLE